VNALEIVAAISLIAVLISYASPSLLRQLERGKELTTLSREQELSSAVRNWYEENAYTIDSAPDGSTVTVNGKNLYLPKNTDSLKNHYTPITRDLITAVSLPAGESFCLGSGTFPKLTKKTSYTYPDGFGDCFLLYATEQKTAPDGIKYRDFYVVSAGNNREVNFDGKDAEDDIVKLVSGYEVEKSLYEETLKKMRIIKDSLENYFYTLYLNDPTRDTTIDYFLRRKTDGTEITNATLIDNSCTAAGENPDKDDCLVPISQIAYDEDGDGNPDKEELLDRLGLTGSDLKDAWGNPILIDTASSHVRSPETGKEAPFTARLVANTPWGDKIEVIVRQKF